MYLYFDEGGYVIGYGSENEPGSVAVQAIPEEVDRYLGAYRYEGGAFIPDEARKAFLEQAWNAQQELDAITRWFNWYDQSVFNISALCGWGFPLTGISASWTGRPRKKPLEPMLCAPCLASRTSRRGRAASPLQKPRNMVE